MDIKAIQAYLNEHELDGWLMADFHGYNSIAMAMLKPSGMITRRSLYFIPVNDEPTLLVHNIEKAKFSHVPGKQIPFSSYMLLEENLKKILNGYQKIAMEYFPNGRLPYIGIVDAGTVELVRSFGCDIVPSADLVANFQARLSPEQIATHRMAAKNVLEIKQQAFEFIAESIKNGKRITEFDVVQYILYQFDHYDMMTEDGPNCSVDANAGNPHYEPTAEYSAVIKKGQLILIDLWAKLKHKDGVYADVTWMGYTGKREEIPSKYSELFSVIASARDAAVDFIRQRVDSQPVYGSDVDDACRAVIEKAGYGEYFTHRTGHSITSHIHGPGPNIDNLETEDKRKLQKGHLFSIEPGVYFEDFGMRTEIDVLIGHDGAQIATLPLQSEILALLD